MGRRSLQEVLDDINKTIKFCHIANMEGLIVDADYTKGFSFPYLLAYPKSNMKNTIVMDCLNNYEYPLPEKMIDNQKCQ